jgi:hypothetical protein
MKIAPHLRAVGALKAPVDQHIKVVGKHIATGCIVIARRANFTAQFDARRMKKTREMTKQRKQAGKRHLT